MFHVVRCRRLVPRSTARFLESQPLVRPGWRLQREELNDQTHFAFALSGRFFHGRRGQRQTYQSRRTRKTDSAACVAQEPTLNSFDACRGREAVARSLAVALAVASLDPTHLAPGSRS